MERNSKYLAMYEKMIKIRVFHEKEVEENKKGNVHGYLHCYTGQEAVAVGVCSELNEKDAVFSTHRAEGHLIAMGADIKAMMAEVFGRVGGTNHGTGGLMHMSAPEQGVLHSNGIVGGGIGLAVGAALGFKLSDRADVAVTFFGDGAANQGVLYEGMNLASIWKLPVIFVLENNGYAIGTPVSYSISIENVAERAKGFNMPGYTLQGEDVVKINEVARMTVDNARNGGGPCLIEVKCDRWRGHNEGDPQWYYRTREEVEHYKDRCCIQFMKKILISQGILTEEMDKEIWGRISNEVDEAVKFAYNSPFPGTEYATRYVWGCSR